MQLNNKLFWSLTIALLLTGFILGWTIKTSYITQPGSKVIHIHDTLKFAAITYKTIPGRTFNIDSLVLVINTFWKDSLKTLYGQGLFEAKFKIENKLGLHEFTLESRIPVDPEANLIIDEQLTLPPLYPKRTFGIYAGLGITTVNNITATLGLKYYLLDHKNFSLTTSIGYLFRRSYYLNVNTEVSF